MRAYIRRVARFQRRTVITERKDPLATLQQSPRQPQHRTEIGPFRRQRNTLQQSSPSQQTRRAHRPQRLLFGNAINSRHRPREQSRKRPRYRQLQQPAARPKPERSVIERRKIRPTRLGIAGPRDQTGIDQKPLILQQSRRGWPQSVAPRLVNSGLQIEACPHRFGQNVQLLPLQRLRQIAGKRQPLFGFAGEWRRHPRMQLRPDVALAVRQILPQHGRGCRIGRDRIRNQIRRFSIVAREHLMRPLLVPD